MSELILLQRLKRLLIYLFLFIPLSVTAQGERGDLPGDWPIDWQAPFFKHHELVGKLWDSHKNAFISVKQFHDELIHYDYVLLGETHNHPDHHRLQASVINHLSEENLTPSVVMEMLSQQSWRDQPQKWHALPALQSRASELNKGWPWELYEPVLQTVVQHQLKLYAGNIDRGDLQRWSDAQQDFVEHDVIREYAYSPENYQALRNNIVSSHCGYGGEAFVSSMSRAQMQRDRIMTESLVDKPRPVVFLAGSGHVRNDYAVPMQLRRKFQQFSYLSVAFISVQEGELDPKAYLQNGKAIYDIIYFTPSHTNQDPCDEFRKQLKKMHHRQTP